MKNVRYEIMFGYYAYDLCGESHPTLRAVKKAYKMAKKHYPIVQAWELVNGVYKRIYFTI